MHLFTQCLCIIRLLCRYPFNATSFRDSFQKSHDVLKVSSCRSNALLNFGSADARGAAAEKLAAAQPRAVVYDRRRKLDLAQKLQARWQRWELSNFDYLMQVRACPVVVILGVNIMPIRSSIAKAYLCSKRGLIARPCAMQLVYRAASMCLWAVVCRLAAGAMRAG